MALDLKKLSQLAALDKLLRNWSNPPTLQDMQAALISISDEEENEQGEKSLSVRTVQRLLMQLRRDFSAEIEVVGKKFYRYADKTFSLLGKKLSAEDVQMLADTFRFLQHNRNLPLLEDFQDLLLRLADTAHPSHQHPVVLYDDPHQMSGRKWLKSLYTYCQGAKPVNITYQPYGKEKRTYCLSPYLLKEYNGRWFLFGLNHDNGLITNLALDRILDCQRPLGAVAYNGALLQEVQVKLMQCIGVSFMPDQGPERVEIRISAHRAHYLRTKPLHPSQQEQPCLRTGFATFTFEVILSRELTTLFLSYGPDLEVVGPESLRDEIRNRAAETLARYMG